MSLKRNKMHLNKLKECFNEIDTESDDSVNIKVSWIIHELKRMGLVKTTYCIDKYTYLGYEEVFNEDAYHHCAFILKQAEKDICFDIACKCDKILHKSSNLSWKNIIKVLHKLECIPEADINMDYWLKQAGEGDIDEKVLYMLQQRVQSLLHLYC